MLNHLQTKRAWAAQRRDQAQTLRQIRRILQHNGYYCEEPKPTFRQIITRVLINLVVKLKGQ